MGGVWGMMRGYAPGVMTAGGLSSGQVAALELWARGYGVRGVAEVLHYTPGYVYQLLAGAREVLGVETNAAAVVVAVGLGLIDLPGVGEVRRSGQWSVASGQ